MAAIFLRHVVILASCVMMLVTSTPEEEAVVMSSPVEAPAAVEATPVEAPAGEEENGVEKRSGYHCSVNGRVYQHGDVFSLPGYSRCLTYRCNNGGHRIERSACERNSRCVPEGSSIREGCRSLRCVKENRGNMNAYYMAPAADDKCDADGKCVSKNVPFEHASCQSFRCVDTGYGGYTFQPLGSAKCKDDYGNCVDVGARFSKWSNGHRYNNCICMRGGGYSCRG